MLPEKPGLRRHFVPRNDGGGAHRERSNAHNSRHVIASVSDADPISVENAGLRRHFFPRNEEGGGFSKRRVGVPRNDVVHRSYWTVTFEKILITATPATIKPIPSIAGASNTCRKKT
jgi:hypothetical protein